MDADLGYAIGNALSRDRTVCAAYGRRFSWEASARQFEGALVTLGAGVSPDQVEAPVRMGALAGSLRRCPAGPGPPPQTAVPRPPARIIAPNAPTPNRKRPG